MEELTRHLVLVVTLLLFIAAAVAAAVKRVRLPYTVALVITGALLAAGGRRLAEGDYLDTALLDGVRLQPGVVLYVLLPLLLFEAAFNLDSRRLFKNLIPITVLAVPAVLLSTAVMGGALYLWGDVPHPRALVAALLFGAMVSTTDAIAVVAIFREIGAPKRLTVLVEGEALFNSGTALVLFTVIAGALMGGSGQGAGALLLGGLRDFVVMALGGVAVGVLIGWGCSKLIGLVDEDPLIEITLSTVCAPGAFLAGGILGVSDVMAVIGAGLTVGNYGRTKISPSSLKPLKDYWHYLAFVANSIIFLLVGFSLRAGELLHYAAVIPIAVGAVLVARALGIFPLVALVNRLSEPSNRIGGPFQTIMWWGGIRGALVLVMALTLSHFDGAVREGLIATSVDPQAVELGFAQWTEFKSWALHLAFGIVFFTILVNAPSTKSLINLLGLGAYTPSEQLEEKGSLLLAKRDVRDRLRELRSSGALDREVYAQLIDRYMLSEGQLRKELVDLRHSADFTREDERRTLLGHCLGGEKAHISTLFHRGDVREDVMRDLHIVLEDQLDRLKDGQDPDEEKLAALGESRLLKRFVRGLASILGTGRLGTELRVRALEREFEAARTRLSAIEQAFQQLASVERAEGASLQSLEWIRAFYQRQRDAVQARLQSLAEVFPSYAAVVQESLSMRYCLRTEREVFRELAAQGRISAKVLNDLLGGLRREIATVDGTRTGELVQPEELLGRIAFFSALEPMELVELARVVRPVAFQAGQVVMKEGEAGDRMFLIPRGEVEVFTGSGEDERVLSTLSEGDFFGEIALLTDSPRIASVRTKTACALLELRRRDLEQVTRAHPQVRWALEQAYRERVLSTLLSRLPLFADLEADERALLGPAFRRERYSRGEGVRVKGRLAASLCVIKEGQVEIQGEGDPEVRGEGESFGAERLCFPADSTVDATALCDTTLLVFRHWDLVALLEREPTIAAKVRPRVLEVYGRELKG